MNKSETKLSAYFQFEGNLNNNRSTFLQLIKLHDYISNTSKKSILLDFSKVDFISANLFAILGCSLESGLFYNGLSFIIRGMNRKIQEVICKNGFCSYFKLEPIEDTFHSTMRYTRFKASTVQLEEFEKYLVINIVNRPQMPLMNPAYKDIIIDSLLEVFNNVIDHAGSNYVYVCGQYFPRNHRLCFSIVDAGRTIRENVFTFFNNHFEDAPNNSLAWAVKPGNTTKKLSAPGGLGLPTLCQFLRNNRGKLTIISDNEIYYFRGNKDVFDYLDCCYSGTIVNVEINMRDNNFYYFKEADSTVIIF